ncbi:MAG: TlpA family protein disulfide reductase [Salinivirgaceae bacterium]|nr:TlpA family protein disulfide reductase [Salinivirgaceae bacterium]
MKQLFITAAVAVAALTACQKAETTISVNLTDLPENTIVLIFKCEGRAGQSFIEDTVKNGTYCKTIKCDSINEKTYYSAAVSVRDYFRSRDIYITPGCESKVVGSGVFSASWTVESSNPHQQFSNNMNNARKDILIEYERVMFERYDTTKTKEEVDSLRQLLKEIDSQVSDSQLKAYESLPVDEYWLERFAASTQFFNYVGSEHPLHSKYVELYNKKLSDADKATPAGKQITMNLFGKTPEVGDKFIDCDLYDIDGNIRHLVDYQGKWMLLDFSTYGCGPCRLFVPAVKYFYEKGVNEKFEIVTIIPDSKNMFEKLMDEEKFTSPFFNDRDGQSGIFSLYKIGGWPTFYLVKPDGTIADSWMGLDLRKVINLINDAGGFPAPEFKTENGVTTINNPAFSDINSSLLIDQIEIYNDSVVLNCTYPLSEAGYHIFPEAGLFVNGKCISKIIRCSVGFEGYARAPHGEVSHCRLTFEPLPQGTTEFDFINGDCDECFRVLGIKVKE